MCQPQQARAIVQKHFKHAVLPNDVIMAVPAEETALLLCSSLAAPRGIDSVHLGVEKIFFRQNVAAFER